MPPDETLDAISGHFRIFQRRDGHRFWTTRPDGVVWNELGADGVSRVDLGSGIGSVGMIAAWRLPGATFVTIEAQEDSVRLAHKSAAYNGLGSRVQGSDARTFVISGDRCERDLRPRARQPAVFPPGSGIEGDHPQKVACRFELRGDVADYTRVAVRTSPQVESSPVSFPRTSAPASRLPRQQQMRLSSGAALLCSAKANLPWSDSS